MGQEDSSQEKVVPDESDRACRYCRQSIALNASVCHYCHRHQNLFWQNLDRIPLLLSIVFLGIAVYQIYIASLNLEESKKQRTSADEAVKKAKIAEGIAVSAVSNIDKIQTDVRAQQDSLSLILKEAKEAKSQLINVDKLTQEAQRQLQDIKGTLRQANEALSKVKSESELLLLLTRANNDDRKAFDSVLEIARSDQPNWELAKQAIDRIIFDLYPGVVFTGDRKIPWEDWGIKPYQLTLARFRQLYKIASLQWRQALLNPFWKMDNTFTKFERMDFLAEIILKEESLRILVEACRLMDQEAKMEKTILEWPGYLKWWEKNKESYRNK